MKIERAIELLNRISDSQFDGIHGDERREALEMAVRALESNLVKESGNLVKDLVEDTISRQQAIDQLHQSYNLLDAEQRLEDLPSAQPHWIPCSERLPEEDEDVLVCSEEGDIDIACWMPEQWTDEPHIEWWSGEYRVYAVAWMPLPKPYGGVDE